MTDVTDYADNLKDLLDEEGAQKIAKNISFEQSTLAYVLRQLGYPAKKVKGLQRDFGAGFTFDWFNHEGFIYPTVESVRIFDFNFKDILFESEKHPISRHVKSIFSQEVLAADEFCLVFKAYDLGRMVATNIDVSLYTHIHVPLSDYSYSITPFKGFFKSKFGSITD